MNDELPFRISLGVLIVALAVVRFRAIGWATVGLPRAGGKSSIEHTDKIGYRLILFVGWLWVITPYPMYTAFAVIALAYWLISTNWLIAIIGMGYWIIVVSQVGVEEAALIEKFGDAYRTYMKYTRRFLPRLFSGG